MNLTTDDADGKIRLDQYLAAHLPELSRSRIQSLIKSGDVLVNGTPAKPKNPVSRGDSITVRIPEPEPAEARPQDIPLDILYEDEDVVVINKESGMVVHPAAGNPDGTIVVVTQNALEDERPFEFADPADASRGFKATLAPRSFNTFVIE